MAFAAKRSTSTTKTHYSYDGLFQDKVKCLSSQHLEEGKKHFQTTRYKQALQSFETALEHQSSNIKALLARSKCYMHLMQYDKALRDADAALEEDADCSEAIVQKGEIEYLMGDFEFAYLTFLKGSELWPTVKDFALGMQKCQTAMRNCVEPSSEFRGPEKDKFIKGTNVLPTKEMVVKKPLEIDRTSKKLLGKAAVDKEFLREIIYGKHIRQSVCSENQSILKAVQRGLDFLNDREKYWQKVRLLNSKQKADSVSEIPSCELHREVEVNEEEHSHLSITTRIERKLQGAAEALTKKNFYDAIEVCKSVLDLMDRVSVQALPNKAHLAEECLNLMESAFLKSGDCSLKAKIAAGKINPDDFKRFIISLYKDYAASEKYMLAAQCLMCVLTLDTEASKKAYILREIGSTFFKMKDFQMARYYAVQSFEYASKIKNPKWRIESSILLGEIEMANFRDVAALEYFENAVNFAMESDTKEDLESSEGN